MKIKGLLFRSLLVLSIPALLLAQGAGDRVADPYKTVENDLVEVEGEIEALIEDGSLEKGSQESESVVSILSEIQELLIQNNINVDTGKLDDLKDALTDTDDKSDTTTSGGNNNDSSASTGTGETPVRPKYYVVKKRQPVTDCLWRIAGYSFIYNNPTRWNLIYEANRSIIKDADLIYPGQVIEIPSFNGEERSGTYDN